MAVCSGHRDRLTPIGEQLRRDTCAADCLPTDDPSVTVLDDPPRYKGRLRTFLKLLGRQFAFNAARTHERDGPDVAFRETYNRAPDHPKRVSLARRVREGVCHQARSLTTIKVLSKSACRPIVQDPGRPVDD